MSVENILREIGDPSNSQVENPPDAEKSASSAAKSPPSAAALGDKRKVGNIRYNSKARLLNCYLHGARLIYI